MTNQLAFKCPKCNENIPADEDGLLLEHGHLYTGLCPGSNTPVGRETPFSDNVAKVAERLLRRDAEHQYGGACVVLGDKYSAGPYTPAVEGGFDWAVLDLQGAPVVLAHDAYDAAVWFCKLESGAIRRPEGGAPLCLVSNEEACRLARIDSERDSIQGFYSYYAAKLDQQRATTQKA